MDSIGILRFRKETTKVLEDQVYFIYYDLD